MFGWDRGAPGASRAFPRSLPEMGWRGLGGAAGRAAAARRAWDLAVHGFWKRRGETVDVVPTLVGTRAQFLYCMDTLVHWKGNSFCMGLEKAELCLLV